MSKEFETGLKRSISMNNHAYKIGIIAELIRQVGLKKVKEALDVFLNHQQIDTYTDINSDRVLIVWSDKFEQNKKPMLKINIGERLPDKRKFYKYAFLNSILKWKKVCLLVGWAIKKNGKLGTFDSIIYVVEVLLKTGTNVLSTALKFTAKHIDLCIDAARAFINSKKYLIKNKKQDNNLNIIKDIIESLQILHLPSPQYIAAINEFSSLGQIPYIGIK
jgi:hypothetical protein